LKESGKFEKPSFLSNEAARVVVNGHVNLKTETRMQNTTAYPEVAKLAGSLDDKELAVFLQMKAMFPMIDGNIYSLTFASYL
jgi:hypothetical protein